MAEIVTKLLGPSFLSFANFAAINDNVMIVGTVVDLEGAKGETIEAHMRPPGAVWSRALLGGDGGEGGPALLHFLATAVRAENFALFVVDQ
jgi:hypothetical protein